MAAPGAHMPSPELEPHRGRTPRPGLTAFPTCCAGGAPGAQGMTHPRAVRCRADAGGQTPEPAEAHQGRGLGVPTVFRHHRTMGAGPGRSPPQLHTQRDQRSTDAQPGQGPDLSPLRAPLLPLLWPDLTHTGSCCLPPAFHSRLRLPPGAFSHSHSLCPDHLGPPSPPSHLPPPGPPSSHRHVPPAQFGTPTSPTVSQ